MFTNLNPQAPEFYPNFITPLPTFTHPTILPSPFFYPPPQPTYFTNFYLAIQPIKTEPRMLLAPAQPAKPTCELEHERKSEIRPDHVVGRTVVNRRPRSLVRVPRQQPKANWFWVRKDVVNHPVAKSINYPFGDSTTLMIRNIPVRYSRKEILGLLDKHCRMENEKIDSTSTVDDDEPYSEFDFLYLPVDFKRRGNLGYAFVNFTTWQGALRLYKAWNGAEWDNCPYQTKKIRQINRAKFQGKKELKAHFEKSVFVCELDEYLPVEIIPARNGVNDDETKLVMIGTRACKILPIE